MTKYFNDTPIEFAVDDKYGMVSFAKMLAKSMLNMKNPWGTVIALTGPWGSGKSSTVNLIRNELRGVVHSDLVVTEFKCWWYRGEDALALAFLQNLHAVLRDSFGDKVKNLVPDLTRSLLQAGPVLGQAISLLSGHVWASAVVSGTSKFASAFFPKGDTVEKTFQKLTDVLQGEQRRFVVIIDDIDRLSPEETLAVFRLVKSIGRLPNVMYLLVFDRELAEKTVQERYPSEGAHFLEKIVQAGFELPNPLQIDLNTAVLTSVQKVCGDPDEVHVRRIMNLFYDVIVPYITTPRHAARLENAISVTWPAITNEINIADFLALETLRLYEPALFKAIRFNKAHVCGVRKQGDPENRNDARFDRFLQDVPDRRRLIAQIALQRLFPRLEAMGYGGEFIRSWDLERRVCVERHFDTYFRLSLSEEVLPVARVNEMIEKADDRTFIQTAFHEASTVQRRSGKSMVPIYLEELTTHAKRVVVPKVGALLQSLFEIHDEIDLERDKEKGFMGISNTSLRFHWLIRALTRDRFTLDERTDMYLYAMASASFGWLVDFTTSARDDYAPREDRQIQEADCLIAERGIASLTEAALSKIRGAAADGTLLRHQDLLYILYRWSDFMDDNPVEVRAWTDSLMSNDVALVVLAKSMTGQSWSFGMGGHGSLGDRVSTPTTRAQISDDINILDPIAFRANLERIISENALDENSLEIVRTFLTAWDRGDRRR